jgi:undecaprenyl-diphosphatase
MERLFDADRRVYLLLHSRWRAPWLDPIMVWSTRAGTKGVVWLALLSGLLVADGRHGRSVAFAALAALLLAEGVINIALKPAIARERPFTRRGLRGLTRLLVDAPGPHSWPSAHAGSSMAAAAVLAAGNPALGPLFLFAALLIAYSRVYVGVHYPLDVLAGVVVGVLSALAVLIAAHMLLPGSTLLIRI